jgi:hypothetical protein
MRNDRLKISLYLFIATIVFLVPGFIWGAQGMTNDPKDNCHTPPGKEGADCKMFNDGVCLKGKLGPVGPGGKQLCIHNANPGAAVLMFLGFIALIVCLVYLFMGLFGKKLRKGTKRGKGKL